MYTYPIYYIYIYIHFMYTNRNFVFFLRFAQFVAFVSLGNQQKAAALAVRDVDACGLPR